MTHPPPTRSDAALVRASIDDADAFRALYDRHAARVHAGLLRQTRDPDAAHDLTAETFAQAWLVRARFRDKSGGSALPWLLGIARNVLLTSVRRRTLEQRACERLGLRERLDGPPAAVEPAEAWLDDADALLDELPPAHREALRLRIVEDHDYAGVAAALGTTEQNARVRVHRALRTLRSRMTTTEMSR
ncbi:MAG TPA: RNA polymerase sigma factor [Baekduia sp.]|nr:RNA polymerase sigma factor [Baekduia sp.]